MVRVQSSFTLDQLMSFGRANYEAFGTKSRLRKHAYYRQIAAYLAIEGGYKVGKIAEALDVTHATVVWSREKSLNHLVMRNETYCKYYEEFVNRSEEHTSEL